MQKFVVTIAGREVIVSRDADGKFIIPEELKRWEGMGSALKPAWEPIILAMKPCEGTFAENALQYGVAGLHITGGRIGTDERLTGGTGVLWSHIRDGKQESAGPRVNDGLGRWPANLLLDEDAATILDEQSGQLTSGANPTRRGSDKFRETYSAFVGQRDCIPARGVDTGGASRFFYVAKADSAERAIGGDNNHPTVKPVDLAAYLAKLLLPPKRDTPRKILVPFSGSGSEIIGALRAGWEDATGIELSPEYVALSRRRIYSDSPLLNEESVEVNG